VEAAVETGIIIVDHGSRRAESNEMLKQAVQHFSAQSEFDIVEPAHMELAEPSISQAYQRCVERGATKIVVFPYFLSPGRHWSEDIPRLTAAAAGQYPGTSWLVTAPFGMHPGMMTVINDRLEHCLSTFESDVGTCDVCDAHTGCRHFRGEYQSHLGAS